MKTASENKIIFEENQTESLLQPHIKMTQHGMMRKLKMTSGVLQKISFIAITWTQSPTARAERRIISYSDEVHRRYQNNTYITGCIVGEDIDDYWNVDGERIIRCMDKAAQDSFY